MPFLDIEDRTKLWKPDTVDEYKELQRWIGSIKDRSESEWIDVLRWYCRNDLFYLLNFMMSDGTVIHSSTKELFHFHPYYLEKCRATEYHAIAGHGVDYSARSTAKSTVRTKAFPIMMMLNYPDIAMIIFSVEKNLAKKHSNYIRQELTENKRLQTLFPDVLWDDPKKQTSELGLPWSAEEGFTIRRTKPRKNATVEVHAVFGGGPIGSRPDMILVDDIESSEYVNSKENIDKLKQAYSEAVTLATPAEIPHQIVLLTNTQFSDAGLVASKIRQYQEEDPKLVIGYPMEDLKEPGDGPLGGTPKYPATAKYLHEKYRETEVKEEYSLQFALDYGGSSSLDEKLINFYADDIEEIARKCVTYICVDASRGVEDPTGIWVWGIDQNGHKWWLDGVRKRLDPTKLPFMAEIERLLNKWQELSQRVVQIRVDQLGNQSWADLIRIELMRRGLRSVPVIPCTSKGKKLGLFDKGKNERIYQFWSPMLNRGEVHFPVPRSSDGKGISARDEEDKEFCLVDYFLKHEYGKFPRSRYDDLLDAGALIEEDKTNKETPLQRGSDRMKQVSRFGYTASSKKSNQTWMSA